MPVEVAKPLRFATLNVRGLATKKRQNQLYRLATEKDIDVFAVQETKIDREDQTESMARRFENQYNVCVSHAVGNSAGCLLFIRKSIGAVIESVTACVNGRFIVCDFTLSNQEWRVICLYASTKVQARKEDFQSVGNYCKSDRFLVLLGDFNCVCSSRDKTSATPFRDASTVILSDVINESGLEDVGATFNNGPVFFTHFQGTSHARLDRAYLSLEWIPDCREYEVCPVTFSDHCLVLFCIGRKTKNKNAFSWEGWKLNGKLLEDDVFVANTLTLLESLKNEGSCHCEGWELFKQSVKIKAIERSSLLKHEATKQEALLRANLEALLAEECIKPGEYKNDIRTVKQKLEAIDTERYRGALVRARAEKITAGEMPSKRALGLEKWHARRNDIVEIENNGTITRDTNIIETVFFQYYSELFAKHEVNYEIFKRDFLTLMPRLDEETKEYLEIPISLDEVVKAIENLNPGKSPGPDGLTAAFYKKFKNEIAPVLQMVFNEAYDLDVLPPSFSTSHTVLIPKTDDAVKLRDVKSYRPICLTNVDYKILMKVLASRLQTVMQDILGCNQTCVIRGWTIFANVRKALCILECCDATQFGVAMFEIELEKAFDGVPHHVLF